MRILACALAAAFALACPAAANEEAAPGTVRLTQARMWVATDSADSLALADDALPPAEARWQAADLPYKWTRERQDRLSIAWFRLDLAAPEPLPEDPALYLSRLPIGGTFFVNGIRIAVIQGPDEATQVRWRRPHLVRVPPATLRQGNNSILVRVVSREEMTFFPVALFGPEAELRPLFDRRYIAEYSGAQFSVIAGVVVGLFMLAIWWFHRSDTLYLLFGLTCLFWSLRTQTYLTESVPLQWWWQWRSLYYIWTGAFALTVAAFFLRYIGRLVQRWQLSLITYALIGPLLLLASNGALQIFVGVYWIGGLFVLETYVLWMFFRWLREHPSLEGLGMAGAAVATFAFGANDYAVRLGWLPYSNAYALHFGIPVVMIAMGGLLAARFVRALRHVELANIELARKISEKERELTQQYERLREVERREAGSAERQRIMQDMHDGLGSQLLTSLAAVERGALDPKGMAQVLREAIDDMRLAIDTLSPSGEGLLEALGNLRYRLEPRFRAAGIELRFAYRDIPERLDIGTDSGLQILRVLQESLTNVLKHARASRAEVEISLWHDPERLVLGVADDGGGFDVSSASAGRGLSGMRRRARQIGAALEVASDVRGTRITLAYPLRPAA